MTAHWYSVKDMLPKDGQRVITAGPRGGIQICRFNVIGGLNTFWNDRVRVATVTHWMPLPNPPARKVG